MWRLDVIRIYKEIPPFFADTRENPGYKISEFR